MIRLNVDSKYRCLSGINGDPFPSATVGHFILCWKPKHQYTPQCLFTNPPSNPTPNLHGNSQIHFASKIVLCRNRPPISNIHTLDNTLRLLNPPITPFTAKLVKRRRFIRVFVATDWDLPFETRNRFMKINKSLRLCGVIFIDFSIFKSFNLHFFIE